jgi:hypothetical protein
MVGIKSNSYKRSGKFRHLIVEINNDNGQYFLIVRGSIQKFYKGNNSGYFGGFELLEAISILCKVFKLRRENCLICNLEFGINTPVWFNINEYLKLNLSCHKKKYWRFEKSVFIFKYDDYRIKLYRKKEGLLRFEIKYTSITKLKQFGIVTLADLNENTVNMLADSLVAEWKEIIMRDEITSSMMSKDEWEMLLRFTSSFGHQEYSSKLKKADVKKRDSLRQEAFRFKKECLMVIKKYSNGDHKKIGGLIEDLINEFKNTWAGDELICHGIPINETRDNVTIAIDNGYNSDTTNTLSRKEEKDYIRA